MSLLNCMVCRKQNVHSQTWTKFLRFLQVFIYLWNKSPPPPPPPAQKKIIKISGSSLEVNHQRPITGRELIRFQKAVFLIWDISLPKYDKICYATLMFSSFYPYVDIIETGHVRSKSTAILKKWENY